LWRRAPAVAVLDDAEDLPEGLGLACGGAFRPKWSRIVRIVSRSVRKAVAFISGSVAGTPDLSPCCGATAS